MRVYFYFFGDEKSQKNLFSSDSPVFIKFLNYNYRFADPSVISVKFHNESTWTKEKKLFNRQQIRFEIGTKKN